MIDHGVLGWFDFYGYHVVDGEGFGDLKRYYTGVRYM